MEFIDASANPLDLIIGLLDNVPVEAIVDRNGLHRVWELLFGAVKYNAHNAIFLTPVAGTPKYKDRSLQRLLDIRFSLCGQTSHP